MIQNTKNNPISLLFSSESNVCYHIPKYQREYTWGKWNWEALFDDIEDSDGGHFLGSIICINTQADNQKAAQLELVDGQQRMTTLSLLYLAIYQAMKENVADPDDIEIQVELLNIRKRLYLKKLDKMRLTPSLSNKNLEDYTAVLGAVIPELKKGKSPSFLGLRRMHKAFKYFSDRLNSVDQHGERNYSYEDLSNFLEKLNSATLVQIDVATHADAFVLFETLNNRGVPLSAIDLIKNKLLGKLERLETSTLDKNFERWNTILVNLTDEYKVQERFLRQFYNAFRVDERINVDRTPRALRSNLIRIYEELIDRDVNYLFDELEKASLIYSSHIQFQELDYSDSLVKALRDLENVFAADAYMLLLFVTKKYELSEEDKLELVNLLCRYFIRRNVTDSPPTRDLTNYFMTIIAELNKEDQYSFQKLKDILLQFGRPATDEYFEQKLRGDLYEENVGATRYILSSIELEKTETKECYTNFYKREKNRFIWTIEHIFPQGHNIPDHWVEMIANGDTDQATQIREANVHKLGNLTLTAYNPQLSNKSLEFKQNRTGKDGKYIGLKNGLWLNRNVAAAGKWTKESIEKRTDELVGVALDLFKL